jgi:sugar O-acyltransferase (sialic acid O-acetyltransferase NeuD family)
MTTAGGRDIVIVGTGDFARVAAIYLERDSPHDVVAFSVHERYLDDSRRLLGREVVAFERVQERFPPDRFAMFVAIGFSRVNESRAEVFREAKQKGYELITYVSSQAAVMGDVEIGENTFVFEQNVIQPFVRIGDDVVLWSGNHVGHDSTIEDHCFIASHAVISGNCRIGHHTFVGVNATFRDGVTVGPRNVIGAAAVIMKDTAEGAVHAVRHTPAHPSKSWELGF